MDDTHKKSFVGKSLFILITLFAFLIIFLLIKLNKASSTNIQAAGDATIINGIQYVDLTAKGGYFPKVLTAKANQKTVLRVKTSNTFDCSSALSIPSLNYRTNLASTGTTEINIPAQKPNTEIKGTCSMGMYRFSIRFI